MTKDEIAQIMQDTSGMIWGDEAHFQRFAKRLIDIEREACANLCEDTNQEYEAYTGRPMMLNYTCANAIRERGTT